MSAHTPNHPQDQDQIERLHEQFCGGIYDRAIVLQDASYRLGRERGRLEANAALLEACIEGLELLRLRGLASGNVGELMRAAIAAATAQAGEQHG